MDDSWQKLGGTNVEILGKTYQFKCSEAEIPALHKAAANLEEKMREIRTQHNLLSTDQVAVLTALNLSHQLLAFTQQVEERLEYIQTQLDNAQLPAQMELVSE